jgi:hypothetical protein
VNTIWKIPEGIEAPEMVTLLMDFATDSIKEYQIRMALLKRQPVGLDPEDQHPSRLLPEITIVEPTFEDMGVTPLRFKMLTRDEYGIKIEQVLPFAQTRTTLGIEAGYNPEYAQNGLLEFRQRYRGDERCEFKENRNNKAGTLEIELIKFERQWFECEFVMRKQVDSPSHPK